MRASGRNMAVLAAALCALALCAFAQAQPRARQIRLDRASALTYVGGTVKLSVASVRPAGASRACVWGSSDKEVASVDQGGLVTALKPGTARIYARAAGGVKAVCRLTVKRTGVRRALVAGCGAANRRLGAAALRSVRPEVNGVSRAMAQSVFADGYGINISAKYNITKAQLAAAIRRKFSGADESDISYVYLTGHGVRKDGEFYLLPCTDRMVSARELRALLDNIPGKVALVVNTCFSGSVVTGKSASAGFAQGFIAQFLGAGVQTKYTAITGEKYVVLCATGAREVGLTYLDEDTLRYLDVFGTPFAAASGWDYASGERSLLADQNGDFQVTHRELLAYLKGEVASGAAKLGYVQTVTAYPPAGSALVLFDLSR